MSHYKKTLVSVLVIPTGIGCEIGGHAGDGNAVAKLIAASSDLLITHPNVLNASDINEMTENTWYVEGSILDRFLNAEINLKPTLNNKILLVTNGPVPIDVINSVSAARVTLGANIEILELGIPLMMEGFIDGMGEAAGIVSGVNELIAQVQRYKFDALAIATAIDVEEQVKINYYKNGGVNPWGKVEAMVSRAIAEKLNLPVAHSPYEDWKTLSQRQPEYAALSTVVDPRIAPEAVSVSYLHCVLKGLQKAPRIYGSGIDIESYGGKAGHPGINMREVDCLILPINCLRPSHENVWVIGGSVIWVKENKNVLPPFEYTHPEIIVLDSYLEVAGYLNALRAGVDYKSVKRPFGKTKILGTF